MPNDAVGYREADLVFGTHRSRVTWMGSQIGAAILVLMALASVGLAIAGQVPAGGAVGAVVIGVGGGALVWAAFARPHLVVGVEGVEVVNPIRSYRLSWSSIDRFDCREQLVVVPSRGPEIRVAALPAPGLRRVVWGTPGRVDVLAAQLNTHLHEHLHRPGSRQPVSIETSEGRFDIRVLAVLSTVGVLIGFAIRVLVERLP